MKKLLPALLILALCFASITCYFSKQQPRAFKGQAMESTKEINEEDNMQLAMEQEFMLTRDVSLNAVPRERLMQAARTRDQKLGVIAASRTAGPVAGISWQERGPNNVGGRTRSVMYDLNDLANGYKKVWAGSVGGGLWYTNDITTGTGWTKIDDFLGNLAITSLAQDPANKQNIYAGTGEGWFNSDFIRGLGIWKSANGGVNWAQLPSTNNSTFYYVEKVVVNSTGVVFAATRNGGIQRSADNGTTWTKVLGSGVGGGTYDRAADIEIAGDGTMYCSIGIFQADGIYRSTDAGLTWTKIYTSGSLDQRIELACAPSNPDRVYALIQDGNTYGIGSIQTTINASTLTPVWTAVAKPSWCDQGSTSTDFTRTQAWYDLIAAVDPTNESILYIGGVDIHKSINAGTSWTQVSQWSSGCTTLPVVHADIHSLVFRPDAASVAGANAVLLVGSDGGVYRTANSGASFTSGNAGYDVTQYYSVAMHPTNPNYFLAGAQDNGTQKFTTAGINSTSNASGGDGGFCHIDQNEPNIQITSFTGNNYTISLDGGATFASRSFSNGSFINPTDYDDAGNKLYACNVANSYLRWENPSTGGNTATTVFLPGAGNITHVAVSPLTANRVYFGSDNGSVFRVDNAQTGTSKTSVQSTPTGAGGAVSCIAIDPADENHQLVTYSNYGAVHVWETKNATSATPTYASVSGDLPDMPVRWAMFDPRNSHWALIATELGVWSTDNLNSAGVTSWSPTNLGFANVRVDMLQYRPSDRTIAAATHGRGLFTATVPAVTTPDINFAAGVVSLPEATTGVTATCRNYKDYTVQMNIANAPSANATVTLSLNAGNTATEGIDFDYTTNGDFSAPSKTFDFTPASFGPKNITVRIYDDAEVEGDESFVLSYAITGTSNAQKGSSFQTISLNIPASDSGPVLGSTANYTIGALNYYIEAGAGGATTPFDARLISKRSQILYKASELIASGLTPGNINSFRLAIDKHSTRPYQNVIIKMGLTSLNALVDVSTSVVPTTTVKNAFTFTPAAGYSYNTFTLDAPFSWDGTSSLAIEICYNNGTADAANAADRAVGYLDGTSSQGNMIWQDNIDCSQNFTSSNYFVNGLRPQIIFNFTSSGTQVSTVLNTTRTEYFANNNDLYFYSNSNIIGRVQNLTAFNYGCTQMVIDRDGAGATPFWYNIPSTYLMNKTYRVLPTTNNPAGQYTVTFYFTPAEVAAWQTATGQLFSNIQVVKVANRIDDVKPATPTGGGAIDIVTTPIRGTFGLNSTLTATFNTGFSGFGFGIPGANPLPVTFTTVNAYQKNTGINVEWKTATESQILHYEVEKSADGQQFSSATNVAPTNNNNGSASYNWLDVNPFNGNNFFRIKAVERSGTIRYSQVVNVKIGGRGEITVYPNPVADRTINLQLKNQPAGMYSLRLLNSLGQQIFNTTINHAGGSAGQSISLNPTVAKGVYQLQVSNGNNKMTQRIIIQ